MREIRKLENERIRELENQKIRELGNEKIRELNKLGVSKSSDGYQGERQGLLEGGAEVR